MNKMVLVPEAHVEELKRLPEIIQTVDIQKDIDELMTNPNISNTDKMHSHGKYMLKYNSFKDQATDIDDTPKAPTYVPEIITPISNDNVITNIPKSMQKPIRNLLDQIKGNTNITWDDKGTVSIKGKVIVGSNINDIMNDAARERKSRMNAVGWVDVAEELINKNQYINVGNKRWNNYVNKKVNNKPITPSSKKHSKSTKRLQDKSWEKW